MLTLIYPVIMKDDDATKDIKNRFGMLTVSDKVVRNSRKCH